MEKKNSNEELQSRREFFKKAAKAALPVVGAVVLSSLPINPIMALGSGIVSGTLLWSDNQTMERIMLKISSDKIVAYRLGDTWTNLKTPSTIATTTFVKDRHNLKQSVKDALSGYRYRSYVPIEDVWCEVFFNY